MLSFHFMLLVKMVPPEVLQMGKVALLIYHREKVPTLLKRCLETSSLLLTFQILKYWLPKLLLKIKNVNQNCEILATDVIYPNIHSQALLENDVIKQNEDKILLQDVFKYKINFLKHTTIKTLQKNCIFLSCKL